MSRILAIWTRPLDGVEDAGRTNVARSVRAALGLSECRVAHALEPGYRLRGLLAGEGLFAAGAASAPVGPERSGLLRIVRVAVSPALLRAWQITLRFSVLTIGS